MKKIEGQHCRGKRIQADTKLLIYLPPFGTQVKLRYNDEVFIQRVKFNAKEDEISPYPWLIQEKKEILLVLYH